MRIILETVAAVAIVYSGYFHIFDKSNDGYDIVVIDGIRSDSILANLVQLVHGLRSRQQGRKLAQYWRRCRGSVPARALSRNSESRRKLAKLGIPPKTFDKPAALVGHLEKYSLEAG